MPRPGGAQPDDAHAAAERERSLTVALTDSQREQATVRTELRKEREAAEDKLHLPSEAATRLDPTPTLVRRGSCEAR